MLETLTLEELDLEITLYSPACCDKVKKYETIPFKDQIGPLCEFHRLWELRVPFAALLGWSPQQAPSLAAVLPGSLTYLCLAEDLGGQCTYQWSDMHVLEILEPFFAEVSHAKPVLKVFEFIPYYAYGRWEVPLQERLRAMCSQTSVECIIEEDENYKTSDSETSDSEDG